MTTPAWQKQELQLIAPSRSAAATASQTANLDMQGSSYASLRVNMSSELNTNNAGVIVGLKESDDTVVANFATIAANQTIDNTNASQLTYNVDMRGRKRYLRLEITPDTTTNGTVGVAADATAYRLGVGPGNDVSQTTSTNDTVVDV